MNPKLDYISVYMVLWIVLPTGIFTATYNVMNVERALITTMESKRNRIAICEVVASRKSATICRQITFVRDTWIYTRYWYSHTYLSYRTPTRPGSIGCKNCTTSRDAVPSAKHKAASGNGNSSKNTSPSFYSGIYERTRILVKRL